MNRRNFVKRLGLASGVVLAGSGLSQVWGKDTSSAQPTDGLFTFLIGNVDYYTYRYSFAKHPARTTQKLKGIIHSGRYPLLTEDCFDRMEAGASVVTCRVACPDGKGPERARQMFEALQTGFPETFAGAMIISPLES